jgi:hypothetical protein
MARDHVTPESHQPESAAEPQESQPSMDGSETHEGGDTSGHALNAYLFAPNLPALTPGPAPGFSLNLDKVVVNHEEQRR